MKLQRLMVIACLGLTACGGSGSSNTSATKKLSPADMLVQVRAAGQTGNELDVQPLHDPQVEDLRMLAATAEARGDLATANRALAHALRLAPDDPDLLQWQAELALLSRDWGQSEQLAARSFEKGPKLGGLCRRSWMTIHFARQARGDTVNATQAQQQVATCAVTPPVRM